MGVNFRVQPQTRQMLAVMAPAGGVCLNIEDFARFAAAETDLGSGRPAAGISAKTLGRLPALRPADAPGKAGAGETFFGGDGFFTAAFAVWPEQRLAIVAASNAGDSDDLCAAAIKALRWRTRMTPRRREARQVRRGTGSRVMAEARMPPGGWSQSKKAPSQTRPA
jgi:CubicO group peptidase (beta-lactamase class C family)